MSELSRLPLGVGGLGAWGSGLVVGVAGVPGSRAFILDACAGFKERSPLRPGLGAAPLSLLVHSVGQRKSQLRSAGRGAGSALDRRSCRVAGPWGVDRHRDMSAADIDGAPGLYSLPVLVGTAQIVNARLLL